MPATPKPAGDRRRCSIHKPGQVGNPRADARGYGCMSDTADKIDITKTSEQRTCEEPGCETVLSRYNEFEYCSLHQPMVVPRMRGKVL